MARTYTLESVEAKIANVCQFLARAAKKRIQLENLNEIRARLLSPENTEKLKASLARKRAEIDRAERQIAAFEANQKNQKDGIAALERSVADSKAENAETDTLDPSPIVDNGENDENDA